MVILFTLLAALSNAVNDATQHIASIAEPRRSSGWRLAVYLFRNPLWLFGWVALARAFVFQALALHNGEISVVQPLPSSRPPRHADPIWRGRTFIRWPVHALVVGSVAALFLQQASLHVGTLRARPPHVVQRPEVAHRR
jgi:hypothetical protein